MLDYSCFGRTKKYIYLQVVNPSADPLVMPAIFAFISVINHIFSIKSISIIGNQSSYEKRRLPVEGVVDCVGSLLTGDMG